MTADPIFFIVPGNLDTPTGGYIYDRHVVEGLRARGWLVELRRLDGAYPYPAAADRIAAAATFAAAPDDSVAIVDGLALGALPREARDHAGRLRLIGFVHLPLADETGIGAAHARALHESEREALTSVRHIVVPSSGTRDRLREQYGVNPADVTVIEPGTDRAPAARGSSGDPVRLLCVATLTPRKGHETLLRALAQVPDRHWRLTCAGSDDRDHVTANQLRALAGQLGIDAQVRFIGSIDQQTLGRHYDESDAFVLATFREGFCMGVAEALAHGLPVVSTPECGVQDFIRQDAGILAPPADVQAWSTALATIIGDAQARARLAAGARRIRERLPDWNATVQRWEDVIRHVQR